LIAALTVRLADPGLSRALHPNARSRDRCPAYCQSKTPGRVLDRPWGSNDPPAVVYNDAPGLGHAHASTFRGGYRGILQRDDYGTYKKLLGSRSAQSSITLVACWGHVRRGVYGLEKSRAPITVETLKRVATLCEIEERGRGESAADRLALRYSGSKPLVAKLPVQGRRLGRIVAAIPVNDGGRELRNRILADRAHLFGFMANRSVPHMNNVSERHLRPSAICHKVPTDSATSGR
jgi:transposase